MTATDLAAPPPDRCPICKGVQRQGWGTGHRHRPPCRNRNLPPSEWTSTP